MDNSQNSSIQMPVNSDDLIRQLVLQNQETQEKIEQLESTIRHLKLTFSAKIEETKLEKDAEIDKLTKQKLALQKLAQQLRDEIRCL